jgi:LmbE family N-acetylglucosaminyl deacetylase
MKLTFNNERVLAVMAHPDDAELFCAGTLARAREEGAAVGVCVMCCGDKGIGQHSTHNIEHSTLNGEGRKREAEEAVRLLGGVLYWFEGRDGELVDSYENRKRLVEIYRQFKPTLVITHSPEDYHVDHRATYVIAEAATWLAASRGHVTETAALETAPGLWLGDTLNMSGFEPGFYVNVSGQMEMKRKMLECHQSQLARGGDKDFSPLGELMERQGRMRGEQAGVEMAEAFRWQQSFKRIRAW